MTSEPESAVDNGHGVKFVLPYPLRLPISIDVVQRFLEPIACICSQMKRMKHVNRTPIIRVRVRKVLRTSTSHAGYRKST